MVGPILLSRPGTALVSGAVQIGKAHRRAGLSEIRGTSPRMTDGHPLVPPNRSYRLPGWNSWFGNTDASGVLMTTKFWSAVLWHPFHPALIFFKVSAYVRGS